MALPTKVVSAAEEVILIDDEAPAEPLHLAPPPAKRPKVEHGASGLVSQTFQCPSCYEEVPAGVGVSLSGRSRYGCGHSLCSGCFQRCVTSQIQQKELSVCPFCPSTHSSVIPNWLIHDVLGRQQAEESARLEQLHLQKMKGGDEALRLWQCPIPDCQNKYLLPPDLDVEKIEDDRRVQECMGCGKRVCIRCRVEEHDSISCDRFRAWRSENNAADASFAEMLASGIIKPCPECSAPILKEQGCNFMTCSVCKSPNHMCWVTGKARYGPSGCGGGHDCH
eukprot:TRINITY_DN27572_c0_g1_i1.p1 TRINITY_DN27572_c0_g1~~TRINITY_DN27572_c0_g1_i1.p1  ORF type:complete len:279 (+),score=45.54 TRINITY_DN27572_c0_g1_i1:175-1011(+)